MVLLLLLSLVVLNILLGLVKVMLLLFNVCILNVFGVCELLYFNGVRMVGNYLMLLVFDG